MTRSAPLLTLLSVGVLGGALFMANSMGDASSTTTTATTAAAASEGAEGNGNGGSTDRGVDVQLSELPVAGGAEPPGQDRAAAAPGQQPDDAEATGEPAPERIEIDVADIPVGGGPVAVPEPEAAPGAAPGAAEAPEVAPAPEVPAPAPPVQQAPAEIAVDDSAYAGVTAGGEMTVALAVADGRAVAYVCDNAGLEVWLSGTASDGTVELVSASGKSTMNGSIVSDELSGTVNIDGDSLDYTADQTDIAAATRSGRPDVADVAERVGLTP